LHFIFFNLTKYYHQNDKIVFFSIIIFSSISLFAQNARENNGIINGTIPTNDGKSPAGATIILKGSKKDGISNEVTLFDAAAIIVLISGLYL
jgi:hypothetical protein